MNFSFDKSSNDQGKRLHPTHSSQCRSPLHRVFLNYIFAKHGLYLTFASVYMWSVSIFYNYCVAKSI